MYNVFLTSSIMQSVDIRQRSTLYSHLMCCFRKSCWKCITFLPSEITMNSHTSFRFPMGKKKAKVYPSNFNAYFAWFLWLDFDLIISNCGQIGVAKWCKNSAGSAQYVEFFYDPGATVKVNDFRRYVVRFDEEKCSISLI